MVFDSTPPTLTDVAIATVGTDTTRAKVGDVVTVTLISDEDIVSPTCSFSSGGTVVSAVACGRAVRVWLVA